MDGAIFSQCICKLTVREDVTIDPIDSEKVCCSLVSMNRGHLKGIYHPNQTIVSPVVRSARLLVVDSDSLVLTAVYRFLTKGGFEHVSTVGSASRAAAYLAGNHCELILIDACLGVGVEESVNFIRLLRKRKYEGLIIVLTGEPSLEMLLRVAAAGADDCLVRGPSLDLVAEVTCRLEKQRAWEGEGWHPEAITEMGLFRSLGLTTREIEVLKEYARGFPRQRELADRMGEADVRLRKTFSEIYGKLREPLTVDNPARLAQLLSICAMNW